MKSKIHNYGNENESEWPPRFPKGEKRGVFHWDEESQTMKQGRKPNPNNCFGTPPMVMFDSMPAEYHEGAGRLVESRKEWEQLDRETGSMTFSSVEESKRLIQKGKQENDTALKADRRRAGLEAIRKVRANPKEIRQKLNKEAEKQLELAEKSGLKPLLEEKGIL